MARDQVGSIMGELTGMVEASVKGLGRDLTVNLRAETPKDTGLAASSWIPNVGKPGPAVSSKRTAEGVQEARRAQEMGLAGLATYKLYRGPIFVSNPQPYVLSLNDGNSSQAPSGFIPRTVTRTVRQTARKRSA